MSRGDQRERDRAKNLAKLQAKAKQQARVRAAHGWTGQDRTGLNRVSLDVFVKKGNVHAILILGSTFIIISLVRFRIFCVLLRVKFFCFFYIFSNVVFYFFSLSLSWPTNDP